MFRYISSAFGWRHWFVLAIGPARVSWDELFVDERHVRKTICLAIGRRHAHIPTGPAIAFPV